MAKTIIGIICESVECCWQNLRKLFHRNDSIFDILFLVLYFLEQVGLFYFTIKFRGNTVYLPYTISFFALVLLTTIGVHRLFMESKNRFVRDEHNKFVVDYYKLESSYNLLHSEYKQQTKLLEELFKENDTLFKRIEKFKR